MAKHAATSNSKASASNQAPAPKKKRRHKGLVITLVTLLAVFGICITGVGVLLSQFDYQHDNSYKEGKTDEQLDADLGITNTTLTKKVVNIALFGVDSRSKTSFKGNSDSIMIISIDQIHNKIKLTSVMRDTLVLLPDNKGYSKINAAFAKSPDFAIKTLNQCFNLNIRDYAVVNFVGMADIIDALGGIEVDVTESERQNANIHINSMSKEVGTPNTPIKKAGKQTLTGAQAVAWARIRYVKTADGVRDDYGRTDRQRYVMEQLFNKALSAGVSQYPALIKALLPYMQTSLSYSDILNLAGILTGGVSFEQSRIPLTEYVISGGFYDRTGNSTVYYNLEYAGKVLHAFVYDDIAPEEYIKQNGVDKTRWAG